MLDGHVDAEGSPPRIIGLDHGPGRDGMHGRAIAGVVVHSLVMGRAARARRHPRAEAVTDRARRIDGPLQWRRNGDPVGIPHHGDRGGHRGDGEALQRERAHRRSRGRRRVGRHTETEGDDHREGCRGSSHSPAHRLHGTHMTEVAHGPTVEGWEFWTVFGGDRRDCTDVGARRSGEGFFQQMRISGCPKQRDR
jgi:hypothetical protein